MEVDSEGAEWARGLILEMVGLCDACDISSGFADWRAVRVRILEILGAACLFDFSSP